MERSHVFEYHFEFRIRRAYSVYNTALSSPILVCIRKYMRGTVHCPLSSPLVSLDSKSVRRTLARQT